MTGQESKSARVSMAVTPQEKQAMRAVAAARGTDEGNVLRGLSLDEVVAEFAAIQGLINGKAA